MKQQKQSGFAHLMLITVILGLAVVGLLGFVFWQNFMQPKSTTKVSGSTTPSSNVTPAKSVDPSQVALTETASDQTGGSGLTLKYPKSWTYNHSTSTSGDVNTMISPDSQIKITMNTNLNGLGGTCGSDDLGLITNVDESPVPELANYNFVAANIQYNSGKYSFLVGVESNETLNYNKKLTVGGSGCILGLGIIFSNNKTSSVSVEFPTDSIFNKQGNITLSEINNFKLTDNYKLTKRILESLSFVE